MRSLGRSRVVNGATSIAVIASPVADRSFGPREPASPTSGGGWFVYFAALMASLNCWTASSAEAIWPLKNLSTTS